MSDAAAEHGLGLLEITTRSGGVVVWARAIARPEIVRGAAEIQGTGLIRSAGSARIEVACPEGWDVVIGSSSGRVECHGPLGRVAVTGHSGRISIEQAQAVEVRSFSGAVTIGRCEGTCRVAVTSGSVEIGSSEAIDVTVSSGRLEATAVGDAVVRSGSGRVTLGLSRAGSVDVCSVSGRVSVAVPPGLAPELALTSSSGRVESEVASGADGNVVVETSSGRIRVLQG